MPHYNVAVTNFSVLIAIGLYTSHVYSCKVNGETFTYRINLDKNLHNRQQARERAYNAIVLHAKNASNGGFVKWDIVSKPSKEKSKKKQAIEAKMKGMFDE